MRSSEVNEGQPQVSNLTKNLQLYMLSRNRIKSIAISHYSNQDRPSYNSISSSLIFEINRSSSSRYKDLSIEMTWYRSHDTSPGIYIVIFRATIHTSQFWRLAIVVHNLSWSILISRSMKLSRYLYRSRSTLTRYRLRSSFISKSRYSILINIW